MAVHFDEDMLRLSDDYPDQRQRANHPASSVHFSSHQGATLGPFVYPASAGHHNIDHSSTVRRRSSKGVHIRLYDMSRTHSRPSSHSLSVVISDCCNTACDNCRKAKCKCEPGENTGEGCRNCELLGLGTASCGRAHRKADRSLSSLHFSRYTFPPCLQTLR